MITYKFSLPIGDWSNDGHGRCEWFLFRSTKPVEEAREAHFKAMKLFPLEQFFSDYESYLYPTRREDIEKLVGLGLDPKKYLDQDKENWLAPTPLQMALLWADLLELADPTLELEIIQNCPEMLLFPGEDEKGRFCHDVGYGLFGGD